MESVLAQKSYQTYRQMPNGSWATFFDERKIANLYKAHYSKIIEEGEKAKQ